MVKIVRILCSHWLRLDLTMLYAGTKVYACHFVPFTYSVLLWHDKCLLCTERINYRRPYAIKNQLKARNTPLVVGFGCFELA